MLKKVDSRGRLTIPKSLLQQTKIKPGDKVTFRLTASGGFIMEKEEPDPKAQKPK